MISTTEFRKAFLLFVILLFGLLSTDSGWAQELVSEAVPMCTQFVARGDVVVRQNDITALVSNHGTVSAPGNNSTDVRWNGLGYGYEFGLFVAAEVPGKGERGLAVPKRDRNGNVEMSEKGDTVWVRHIVSDGLLSHGGERSVDGKEWWGWHPAECVVEAAPVSNECFADALVNESFVLNDLKNREFGYYPLQGDSTWNGLGLRVETRYVQSSDPSLRDVVFLINRIENRGRVDLHRVVIGMWGDPHIGGANNYQDDLARYHPDQRLVEVWDADGVADIANISPGHFGYQFLDGKAGLTSLTATPFEDLRIADDDQIWDLVQPGRFDTMPTRPGDDVYIFGSGARKLRVGEPTQFAVALILSESTSDLRTKAADAARAYLSECGNSQGFKPVPPFGPELMAVDVYPPLMAHGLDCPLLIDGMGCPLEAECSLDCRAEESCAWMGGPELNPFVITPSRIRETLMEAPASASVVQGEKFIRDPGASPAATLRHTVGVDIARASTDRYQVTTRGFNQSFAGNNLLLVDRRQGAVPSLAFNAYALLPVAAIDVAQAEVVRGSAPGLYGSRADHGVIQFLTKEPLDYPGTSVSASFGENERIQGAFRHAQVLSDRLAFKVVGSYGQAEDLFFEDDDGEDDDDDDEDLDAVEERNDEATHGFARGTLQYRHTPCGCLTVTANVDYAGMQQNMLHDTGEMFADYRLGTGQLMVESEAVFAQIYFMRGDARDSFDYRTGLPIVDKSELFAAQARYKTDLLDGIEHLVVGFDYDRTNSDTGGNLELTAPLSKFTPRYGSTFRKSSSQPFFENPIHLGTHGRNEADDTVSDLGVYLQSRTDLTPQFELLVSGRIDFDNVIDPQFSPHLGLGFHPNSSHAFRFSLNRGFTRPTNLQLFADFPVAGTGLFPVRARGSLNGWSFDAPPMPTSLFPEAGLAARDNGIGMDLDRAFAIGTDSLFASGGLLEGWDALEDFLNERAAAISGFSEGVLRYEDDLDAEIVEVPSSLPEIKPMVTRSIEIGYKGNFENRTFVGIDVFYAKTKNHLSRLQPITPLVYVPNLPTDLTEEIFRIFTDDELARYKLSRSDLGYLYTVVLESLGQKPVGILEPEENYEVTRGPEQLLSWVNYGKADYFGLDLEFRRIVNDSFSYFGNLSWLSDNYFDSAELAEADSRNELSLNAPKFKLAAGVDRTFNDRYRISIAARYIDQFDVRSGVHQGTVKDYFLLDLGLGVAMDDVAPGLRLDIMGENVLDHEHREWVNVPAVGRVVTARLTYEIL